MWSSLAACPAGCAAGSPELAVPVPPGPTKGPIAMLSIFVGCFVLNAGLSCKDLYLAFLADWSSALKNA
jgi:hypothetical protein